MIVPRLVRAGAAAARDAVRVGRAMGSHAAWWLDHRVGGAPRRAPEDKRRRPQDGR